VPAARTRTWTAPPHYDLRGNLRVLRRGPYDPCYRAEGGSVWRATRTPAGPATLRLTARNAGAEVHAEAWGPGSEWALDRLPAMLGAEDDPSAFTPHHPLTREAHRRHPGLRLPRTGLVMEALIPSVLEQKVTTHEAYRAWRLLVRRHGERAPGPHDGMYVMPDSRAWCRIPSWEWHRAGVDSKRSAAVIRAAQRAARLEEAAAMELSAAMARLQLIPGIGPWTAAETLQRSNGDPDALTVGDLHLPRIVGYSLTGARDTDDDGMLELLAPYEGQRHRAARLIMLAGRAPARRQPRFPIGDIARL
jgi:3-methyladenine DNA glycosylase/8-oxoguanine DNA glycosylase